MPARSRQSRSSARPPFSSLLPSAPCEVRTATDGASSHVPSSRRARPHATATSRRCRALLALGLCATALGWGVVARAQAVAAPTKATTTSSARPAPASSASASPAPDGSASPGSSPNATSTDAPPLAPDASKPVVARETAAPPSNEGSADARTLADLEKAPPPPTNVVYLQYGVALGAEVVTSAGALCDNTAVPCILGTGGGITIRAGWRGTGALYLGGAYGFSKQDPNKLLRLAILQQARAEGRYYFATARDIEPYATVGLGVAGYGNEWGIDTYGPAGTLGGGFEAQVTRRTVVGLAVSYRLMLLKAFTDTSGAQREGGVAQFVGLDLVLEQRDPIFTEGKR